MSADITVLLQRSARGDKNAREQLYAAVYPELMQIARLQLGAVDEDSVPTVKRDWRKARAFLLREMSGEA
jgi:ECF sigma factor